MSRWRGLAGAALVLAALAGAAPRSGVEEALRAGHAAFARGDYGLAAAWYEKAADRTTDPGLVAYNLAVARYRQAVTGEGAADPALQEAERLFRCCLDRDDPRRLPALYDLAGCLLRRGAGRAAELGEAVRCYEECLRDPATPPALADAARHNVQKARLLLLQVRPPPGRPPDEPESGDDPRPDRQTGDRSSRPETGDEDQPGKRTDAEAGPAESRPGQKPMRTEERPPPGKGDLPPVPDRAEDAPLSPEDAAEHLKRAAQRIAAEGQTHRRSRVRPPNPRALDW